MKNMKKLITILTITLTMLSSFAVEFKFEDMASAAKSGYTPAKMYLNSVDSGDMKAVLAIKINHGIGAAHSIGKPNGVDSQEAAEKEAEEAKSLFYKNLDNLYDRDILQIAARIHDYRLAATKISVVNKDFDPSSAIKYVLELYKNSAISKDVAINYLLETSKREIRDYQYAELNKVLNDIPLRDLDGNIFMTKDQKKAFYGNFIDFNKVTPASADFLGACVTQYNLVK